MVHLFVAPQDIRNDRAIVRGGDARHLTSVLRAGPGTPLTVADGTGTVYDARVARTGEDVTVSLTGSRMASPASPEVHVAAALLKGRKLDEVIQRLTELGVERITPLHSERSQVRLDGAKAAKAHRRWHAVAYAAAKQSRRARLPVIDEVGHWRSWRPQAPGVVLWEGATAGLREALPQGLGEPLPQGPVAVAIGPEGGLTADEVDATGLPPATLGPTILRAEFAALAGVVAVMTLLGRFDA